MMNPEELSKRVPRGRDLLPIPKNAAESRRAITWERLRMFAKQLGTEKQFASDQHLKDYPAAFLDYHRALWRWASSLTPSSVTDCLNAARFDMPDTPETHGLISFRQHDYILWRAILVSGFKIGEGFKASHYRYFAELALIADKLGDADVFEHVRQRRYGREPKPGHETTRKVKYGLLISWLAGGLWRMGSRNEQCAAFRRWWNVRPSPESVQKAQKRLGLTWVR
jgi:hypothetical protein